MPMATVLIPIFILFRRLRYIMDKKTIEHAPSDVGLIFTFYNLCHIFNLTDHNEIKMT